MGDDSSGQLRWTERPLMITMMVARMATNAMDRNHMMWCCRAVEPEYHRESMVMEHTQGRSGVVRLHRLHWGSWNKKSSSSSKSATPVPQNKNSQHLQMLLYATSEVPSPYFSTILFSLCPNFFCSSSCTGKHGDAYPNCEQRRKQGSPC
jgi:hypothetical protein